MREPAICGPHSCPRTLECEACGRKFQTEDPSRGTCYRCRPDDDEFAPIKPRSLYLAVKEQP